MPDPLAENHQNYTPYHYTFNNPLRFIDPVGLDTVNVNTEQSIQQDDVVLMDDGTAATSSTSARRARTSAGGCTPLVLYLTICGWEIRIFLAMF